MERKRPSWLALVWEVLTSPGKAMEKVVEHPSFWPPGLLFWLLNLLATLSLIPKIREYALWSLEHGVVELSPEQLEAAWAVAPTAAVTGSIAAAVVIPWLTWLAIACLLKIYAAVSTREASFRALFAVSVYGYLPVLLSTLITNAIAAAAPVENFAKVSVSLASFLPSQQGFLYFFLSSCNPFTWWSLVLWGIGGAVAMRAKRPGGIIFYLFVLWLVLALVTSGVAALNMPAATG
nr:YIP1 family protein [Thermacetogenium phaeum]